MPTDAHSVCSLMSLSCYHGNSEMPSAPSQPIANIRSNSSSSLLTPNHRRSRSTGGAALTTRPFDTASVDSRLSAETVWSQSSYGTAEASSLPGREGEGFNYQEHFSFFSPFTTNLALEHIHGPTEDPYQCSAAPLWCMDVRNGNVAIGCGNGQIEVPL